MEVLKFNLSGNTAFFKKPDVNTYVCFTYGHIHKIAIMGIIGACLGLNGYSQQNEDDVYPEFYEKLKHLEIGIVPKCKYGVFSKKVHKFNNSTAFFNKGINGYGANLIITEQWLESPNWDIYIKLKDDLISKDIKNRFLKRKFVYLPYLGKNDHIADINEVEIIKNIKNVDSISKIDSLFIYEDIDFVNSDKNTKENIYRYKETLPYELDEATNQYIFKRFVYTNQPMKIINNQNVSNVDNVNIYFV